MSFFAVALTEQAQDFEIAACHLNYWALEGYWSDRFLLDVGLLVKGIGPNPLINFQVALPFGTVEGALSDLRERLSAPTTLALVFGENVPIFPDDTIDLPRGVGRVSLLSLVVGDSRREATWSSNDFSVWMIKLSTPLPVGETGYLRIRFRVFHPGRAWTWRKSLLAKNGALFDLRVSDLREAWSVPDRDALIRRIRDIKKLYAFVVVPSWLQPAVVHPQPHYLRLLEGRAWESYLGRPIGLWKARKLVIYQWRKENVSTRSRFQGFLDLRRAEPLQHAWNHVRSALVLLLLITAYLSVGDYIPSAFISEVREKVVVWGTGLFALGALGAAAKLAKGRKFIRAIHKNLQAFEDWLLGVRVR